MHSRNFQTKQKLYSTKSWPTLSPPPSKSIAITPLHESPPSPPGLPLSSCTSFVAQVLSSFFICSQFFFFFPYVFYPIAPSPEDVCEGRVWILKFFFALFSACFFVVLFCFVFFPSFSVEDRRSKDRRGRRQNRRKRRSGVCLLLIAQIYRQSPHLFVEVGRSPRLRALKEGAAAATSRIQHWKFEGGTSEFLRLSCFSFSLEE